MPRRMEGRQAAWRCPGANSRLKAELVLFAMGYLHPVHEGLLESSASSSMPAAMSPPTPRAIRRRCPRCLPPATCAAASRSSSGRFAKAGSARGRSMNFSWAAPSCRASRSLPRRRFPMPGQASDASAASVHAMTTIVSVELRSWQVPPTHAAQQQTIGALERRRCAACCRTSPSSWRPTNSRFLSPTWSDARAKNISLEGGALKGARGATQRSRRPRRA